MFTRRENVAYILLLEASDKDLFEIPRHTMEGVFRPSSCCRFGGHRQPRFCSRELIEPFDLSEQMVLLTLCFEIAGQLGPSDGVVLDDDDVRRLGTHVLIPLLSFT